MLYMIHIIYSMTHDIVYIDEIKFLSYFIIIICVTFIYSVTHIVKTNKILLVKYHKISPENVDLEKISIRVYKNLYYRGSQ